MLRVFHTGGWPKAGGEIALDAAESRHLVRVRRVRAGERVIVLDGCGGVGQGVMVSTDTPAARVRIESVTHEAPRAMRELAVGLPKGDVFSEIIRQAVELGATAIHPLLTSRTEVRLDAEAATRKAERWHATAIEACKQSGNPWLPKIHAPSSLSDWINSLPSANDTLRLVAALTPDAVAFAELKTRDPQLETRNSKHGTLISIGPEGDFTHGEYAQFQQAHFTPVKLPGHVLRVETACAAALALLSSQ